MARLRLALIDPHTGHHTGTPSAGSPTTTEPSGQHRKHRTSMDISERHQTTTTANAGQHDESEHQVEHLSLRFQADPRPRCQMFSLHHQAALAVGRRLRRRLGRRSGLRPSSPRQLSADNGSPSQAGTTGAPSNVRLTATPLRGFLKRL